MRRPETNRPECGSTIYDNTATADGGGIYNNGGLGNDSVTLGTSTVSANKAATNGGGLYNLGQVSATGTEIEHNTGTSGGGGIYDGPWKWGTDSVSLATSPVQHNTPDNCEPTGTVTGCTR